MKWLLENNFPYDNDTRKELKRLKSLNQKKIEKKSKKQIKNKNKK